LQIAWINYTNTDLTTLNVLGLVLTKRYIHNKYKIRDNNALNVGRDYGTFYILTAQT